MPRIYDSRNDPYDFCRECFPMTEAKAKAEYGERGDGPDGRGNCFEYDADHPNYDGEDYHCCECGKLLEGWDDYSK